MMRFRGHDIDNDVEEIYAPEIIDKVTRQVDFIETIYQHQYLKDRIVLGGASALLYVHFDEAIRVNTQIRDSGVLRVTTDVDVDVRLLSEQSWQLERTKVEQAIEEVFQQSAYSPDRDVHSETATSYKVPYLSEILEYEDHFRVELDFGRRYPLLTDQHYAFKDPLSTREFTVLACKREQAFANKWRTMLDRSKTADLVDVYKISNSTTTFDFELFMRCAVVECMLELNYAIQHRDIEEHLSLYTSLDSVQPLLPQGKFSQENLGPMKQDVLVFSRKVVDSMTDDDKSAISQFYLDGETEPYTLIRQILTQVDPNNVLNPQLFNHPKLLEQIMKKRQK